MRSSKAQVQMMETIMVLVIFVIILVLGLVFFWGMNVRNVQQSGQLLTEEKYFVLASVIPSLPEIKYSEMSSEDLYIDTSKLLPFKKIITKQDDHYRALFGDIKISIEMTYPAATIEKECTIQDFISFDYPNNCNEWILYDRLGSDFSRKVAMPVSLYFPELDEWRVGRLIIDYTA